MPYIGAGIQKFNTADSLTVNGDASVTGTVNPSGDTASGDAAAVGFTSAEGLILTGQGSTNDITIKNDADADVLEIPTGTTNVTIAGNLGVGGTVTGTGTSVFASLDISGDIDVDGTTNLDAVDIDGAVDMASTLQVDGAITSSAGATITTADNTTQLTLKSTDADGSLGPKLDLTRDSSSPADGDNCGQINFKIDNDAGESTQYGDIFVGATDVSDGSESAHMTFSTMKGGSRHSRMKLHSDETVFNEDSVGTIDFRVESDSRTHMLFVDSSADAVGIGTSSPNVTLHVFGASAEVAIDDTGAEPKVRFRDNGSTRALLKVDSSNNIQFHTGPDGSVAEVGRFDASGNFLVAGTSTTPGLGNTTTGLALRADGIVSFSGASNYFNINRNGTGTIQQFNSSGNTKGSVTIASGGVTYATTSDIRLKQDIEPLDATDKLMAMNPVSYNWKADPDGPRSMGFIAQEMEEIMPEAVNTGNDKMMQMDYGRITPILVSALQDAHKKIEELESRIAMMESK